MTTKIFERDGSTVYYRDFGAPSNTRVKYPEQMEFEFMANNDKVDDLDIIQNDIYDTTEIIKSDALMESHLHNLAANSEGELMSRIAERFSKLARAAHNRKHWTGHE